MHPLALFRYCPKCGSDSFLENDFKSKKCASCHFIYYANIASAVAVIIRNHQNEILVATRAFEPAKGTLDLPGGFIDMDETAEEAVMREVKEETGLQVSSLKYLFSLPNRYEYSRLEVHTMDLFFECFVSESAALKPQDDVADLRFVAIEELQPSAFGLCSIRKAIDRIKTLYLS